MHAHAHDHTLQRKSMLRGLDERQLKMLKAEVAPCLVNGMVCVYMLTLVRI